MSTDAQIIAKVRKAFTNVERPQHFGNFLHCEECAAYDALLSAHNRETLKIDHVANPGSDPMAFSSAHGKAYYLPTLVQFALQGNARESPYLMQLIHLLDGYGANIDLIEYCSTDQCIAIGEFLEHVVETRTPYLESHDPFDQVLRTYAYWTAGT